MKFFSKILTVVLTTVSAAGTLGGAVMFAVGGTQNITSFDQTGKKISAGVGWLNYDAKSELTKEFGNDHTKLLEYSKTNVDSIKAEIKTLEDLLNTVPENQKENIRLGINSYKTILNASGFYDLAIAGVVVMSVSILIAALSAAMAINVENAEDRKKAKRTNV